MKLSIFYSIGKEHKSLTYEVASEEEAKQKIKEIEEVVGKEVTWVLKR